MVKYVNKVIEVLFYILFFVTPLLLNPYSSEVFEFNKMLFVYLVTVLIAGAWVVKITIHKKLVFKKTYLDIPFVVFLLSQILSTLFSIDKTTSFFGYYSRFHGGLLSTLSYLILYWAFVSNMDKKPTKRVLYALLSSACLVAVYGILQHFGIDKHVWVQNVQERVFSTLGQPNWLAAWLVAITPLSWALYIKSKDKKLSWLWIVSAFFSFAALLFTKSRSGLLGFGVSFGVFWGLVFISQKRDFIKNHGQKFIAINSLLLLLILLSGTPWTPKITSLFHQTAFQDMENSSKNSSLGPNITPSGDIRKIVWKGALGVWQKYPLLGSGVETFAFSYYQSRPVEHNLVSEWDFLYNKAHNEYLNFLSTTGIVGLLSYLILILATIFLIFKNAQKSSRKLLEYALLAGYVSILVTNFFGFSVVPVALLFFLFPAISQTLDQNSEKIVEKEMQNIQKLATAIVCVIAIILISKVVKYYKADYYFARGKTNNSVGYYHLARDQLQKAVELRDFEPNYWDELAEANAKTAVYLFEDGEDELSRKLALSSQAQAAKAISLSSYNVHIKRHIADYYISLSELDSSYLDKAQEILIEAIPLSPTDAKIKYNLALVFLKKGEVSEAEKYLQESILLKSNYKAARFAHALLLKDKGDAKKAEEELRYILENIDPNDEKIQRELRELSI